MKLIADNIGVDAGMIMVADMDYLKDVPRRATPKKLGKIFKGIKKGVYKVNWSIPDTCMGDIEGHNETLIVTSGTIFICDPCYIIGDKDDKIIKKTKKNKDSWLEWLEKTDYGRDIKDNRAFIINEMGGDGCFEVTLELEQIKK